VTIFPFSIVTASPATGTLAPGLPPEEVAQVDVEFQLPFAFEYRFAASANPDNNINNTIPSPIFLNPNKFPALFKEPNSQPLFFDVSL
jgi:hypothetical protein